MLVPSLTSSKILSFDFVSFSIIQCWIVTSLSATSILRYTYVTEHQDSISSFFSIIPFYFEDIFLGVFLAVLFFLPSFYKSYQFCSLELTFVCCVTGACSLLLTRMCDFVSLCFLFQNARYEVLAVMYCSPIPFTPNCLKY